jgi:predicted alpha/beta-fold hydrolase
LAIRAAQTAFNRAVLARCPSLSSAYLSPWWLFNGHAETIWAFAARRLPRLVYFRRCLNLSDGGVLALDFDNSAEAQVCTVDIMTR